MHEIKATQREPKRVEKEALKFKITCSKQNSISFLL